MNSTRRTQVLLASIAGLALALALTAFSLCDNRRLDVCVNHIPGDVIFAYFVSWDSDATYRIAWSLHDELGLPFDLDPMECVASLVAEDEHVELKRTVSWRSGDGFGVVTKSREGIWRVYWLPESQMVWARGLPCITRSTLTVDLNHISSSAWEREP